MDFLEFGWPLDYEKPSSPTSTLRNHSVLGDKDPHIAAFIKKELQHGALVGPFIVPPFTPWTQFSPLMTRPKKNSEARRVIIDLSFPKGASVNSGIKKGIYQGKSSKFHLPGIAMLAKKATAQGGVGWLWAADLSRAYRQLRVCPLLTPLLGIAFDKSLYIDVAPLFGCGTSSLACFRTTRAVVWLMRKAGYYTLCYLDDFVGIERT